MTNQIEITDQDRSFVNDYINSKPGAIHVGEFINIPQSKVRIDCVEVIGIDRAVTYKWRKTFYKDFSVSFNEDEL